MTGELLMYWGWGKPREYQVKTQLLLKFCRATCNLWSPSTPQIKRLIPLGCEAVRSCGECIWYDRKVVPNTQRATFWWPRTCQSHNGPAIHTPRLFSHWQCLTEYALICVLHTFWFQTRIYLFIFHSPGRLYYKVCNVP